MFASRFSCPTASRCSITPSSFCCRLHRSRASDGGVGKMTTGDILLLENTRFPQGRREDGTPTSPRALAANGDILTFNDAFFGGPPSPLFDRGALPIACRASCRAATTQAENSRGWRRAPRQNPARPCRADTIVPGGGRKGVGARLDTLDGKPGIRSDDRTCYRRRHGKNTFIAAVGGDCRQVALRERPGRTTARQIMIGGPPLRDVAIGAAGRRRRRPRVHGGRCQ